MDFETASEPMSSAASAATVVNQRVRVVSPEEMRRRRRPEGDVAAEVGGRNDFPLRRKMHRAWERDNDVTQARVITLKQKEITASGHANGGGAFVRIQEVNTERGFRDRICVPAEGLADLIEALQDICQELHEGGHVKL